VACAQLCKNDKTCAQPDMHNQAYAQPKGWIQPVSLGRAISVKCGSQVPFAGSLLQEGRSILHSIAVTKQWMAKLPYIECCCPNCAKAWWM